MTQLDQLTNPVWAALTGEQAAFSIETSCLRYSPEVLPFAAVPEAGTVVEVDPEVAFGPVFFCDVLPELHGVNFVEEHFRVTQMLYSGSRLQEQPHDQEVELTPDDAEEMVELTNVAFPGFFRKHSCKLGRFVGIRENGQLVAMAGERFRLPGLREISAVCTRPGFTGKGYGSHLMKRLMGPGDTTPFLHVSESNTHAIRLYEHLNFEFVRTIDVIKVSRKG